MVNCFFRFRLKIDPILHGLAIASANSWKHETVLQKKYNVNRLNFRDNSTSFDPHIMFVAAVNIYSTSILSAATALNTNNEDQISIADYHEELPYNVYHDRNTPEQMQFYTRLAKNRLTYLYLIDLNPERIKILADKELFLRGYYNQFE